MKSGWFVFLDLFLYFVIDGNFLSVNNFFYSLAVFIFTCNLCSNFYGLEVVFLLNCHGN